MVQFVGLPTLSIFIHDRSSHCPPRLASPRDLEQIGLLDAPTIWFSQDVVSRALIPTNRTWAFILQQNSPAASLRHAQCPASDASPGMGISVNSMLKSGIRFRTSETRFGGHSNIIRSPTGNPSLFGLLVTISPSRSPDPSPPRLSARRNALPKSVGRPILPVPMSYPCRTQIPVLTASTNHDGVVMEWQAVSFCSLTNQHPSRSGAVPRTDSSSSFPAKQAAGEIVVAPFRMPLRQSLSGNGGSPLDPSASIQSVHLMSFPWWLFTLPMSLRTQ